MQDSEKTQSEKMVEDLYIRNRFNESRNVTSWVLSSSSNEQEVEELISAHIDVSDLFIQEMPFVFFSTTLPQTKHGKVFEKCFLISPDSVPGEYNSVLFNDKFFQECAKGSTYPDLLDIFDTLFGDIEQIKNWEDKVGLCMFIVGNDGK